MSARAQLHTTHIPPWRWPSTSTRGLCTVAGPASGPRGDYYGGGRLRAIIEAVRGNRVREDFSDRWSFAREDFERKLYRKRAKINVAFVELADTIPVQGRYSEVKDDIVYEDFLTLLDARERRVVVLLRNGFTRVGEIASKLGYRNHSPVSKALTRIRAKAETFFDNM